MSVFAVTPSKLQTCYMGMRVNIDCNGCCRKARRLLLKMKVIEAHIIDKQQRRIMVRGRFRPSEVAVEIGKKMNRRVEILEIQEVGGSYQDEPERPVIAG